MKRLFFQLIFLVLCFPAISQGWVNVHGTITNIENGYPVPDHPVTIMTDSTGGMFYYNVVYTDSTGLYYDHIPVMSDTSGVIYVQTIDCQDYLHQEIIYYNPNSNNYIRDFQICSSYMNCQANFDYYAYPQGSPDSFHFYDLSTGNIAAWSWSFGDGTGSEEQNPFHTYPGPGTYSACLTITGNNCTDTFCREIVISDTVYHHLYGQVFAGNFPLQTGTVMLFALNPDGGYSLFGEPWPLDSNGVYYFTLVPDGNYLILAIPFDSGNFIPTYFGDVINWQSATQVIIGIPDNPYNINLVMAGQMTFGNGSVSGQINSTGLRTSEVEHINMILMNESWTVIGFSEVSSTGIFDFEMLEYGTYFLRAELPGVICDNMVINITVEKPRVEVYLNFSGNSILGSEEINPGKELISVYPNPVRDQLTILLQLAASSKISIDLFNMNGQLVYNTYKSCNAGQNTFLITLNDYPAGIYTLMISSTDGIDLVRKVIITK